jgi:predicted nucleic acid-binding protein
VSDPFIDTNILIRFLTTDDPVKHAAATALIGQIQDGVVTVSVLEAVIAEAVFVLRSPRLYHLPRAQVVALLMPIVRMPHFQVRNRRSVLRALDLFANTRLHFGDALVVAAMEQDGASTVYSFDHDFDRIPGITRIEPMSTS